MSTIRDVAKLANVSVTTVSRILNNDMTLSTSQETKQKVLSAAKELNYVKKKKTISSPTYKIGILQWFSSQQEKEDNYYLFIRQGIEDYCAKNKIQVIRMFKTDIDYMSSLSEVDGLICLGKFSKSEIKQLKGITKNIVFLDMMVDDIDVTSITLDFNQAVTCAMDYIYSLGHKKIGFLGGIEYLEDDTIFPDKRLDIFKSYCKGKDIEYKPYIYQDKFSTKSGYKMMCKMIESGNMPTAIFAASDPIAIGAMKALHENGYKIPEDISLIGFDNTELSAYTNPPLTTINAPVYAMGIYGVLIINNLINSDSHTLPSAMRIQLPCNLEIRSSCK